MATVAEEVVYKISADDKNLLDAVERSKRAARGLEETVNGIKFKTLETAWDQLGVRSTESIEKSKARVIAAYDAIAKSGTVSADTLKRAHAAMEENLKRLGGEQLSGVETAFGKVEKAVSPLVEKAGELGGAWTQVASVLTKIGPLGAVAAAGVVALGLAFHKVSENAIEQAREMRSLQAITGTSIEETNKLADSFKLLGLDASALPTMLTAFAQEIDSGGKALDRMGISIRNSEGGLKTVGEGFLETRDRIALMSDTSRQAAAVQDLFGRSARANLPLFQLTAEEYRKVAEKAESLSQWTEKNQAATLQYMQAIEESKLRWQGLLNSLTPVIELYSKMLDVVTRLAAALKSMPAANQGTFDPRLGRETGKATGDVGAIAPGRGGLPEESTVAATAMQGGVLGGGGDKRLLAQEVADRIAAIQSLTSVRLAALQTVSAAIEAQTKTGILTEAQATQAELANLAQREAATRSFYGQKLAIMEQARDRDKVAIQTTKNEELVALEQIKQARAGLGARATLATEAEVAVTVTSMSEQGKAVAQSLQAITALRTTTAQQTNTIDLTVTQAFEANLDVQTQAAIDAAETQFKTSADQAEAITLILEGATAKRKQFADQQSAAEVAAYTSAQQTIQTLTETETERLAREYRKRQNDLEASLRGTGQEAQIPAAQRAAEFKLVGVDQAQQQMNALSASLGLVGADATAAALAFQKYGQALQDLNPDQQEAIRTVAELHERMKDTTSQQTMERALRSNDTLVKVLGKDFDLLGSDIQAVTRRMVELANEGVGPLDPRMVDLKKRLDDMKGVRELGDTMREAFGGVGNTVAQTFEKMRDGTLKTKDAFAEMTRAILNDISNNLIARGINNAINALIKMAEEAIRARMVVDAAASSTGNSSIWKAIIGLAGSAIGSYFGGGGTYGGFDNTGAGGPLPSEIGVGARAVGGVVDRPEVALLGEAGPELILNRADMTSLAGKLHITTSSPHALMDIIRGPVAEAITPHVTPYAVGGVVDKPTLALIGERGPELVLTRDDQSSLARILHVPSAEPLFLLQTIRGAASGVKADEPWPWAATAAGTPSGAMPTASPMTAPSYPVGTVPGSLTPPERLAHYALGGVIDRPTPALIGEAGPELRLNRVDQRTLALMLNAVNPTPPALMAMIRDTSATRETTRERSAATERILNAAPPPNIRNGAAVAPAPMSDIRQPPPLATIAGAFTNNVTDQRAFQSIVNATSTRALGGAVNAPLTIVNAQPAGAVTSNQVATSYFGAPTGPRSVMESIRERLGIVTPPVPFGEAGDVATTLDQRVLQTIDRRALTTILNATSTGGTSTITNLTSLIRDMSPSPNIPMLAAGAIVSGPTLALIGEAGPEAVVPLREKGQMPWGEPSRSAAPAYSGPLVEVIVNNNSDATVRQEQSTGPDGRQQITLIIEKTVEQGIGSGRYDRVMRSSYGSQRQGVRL